MTDDQLQGEAAVPAEEDAKTPRVARVLVAVTTIVAILAVFTVGVRTQVLDTDEWVDLSSELLENPEVQESLADHLVDVVYTEVDVSETFAELLPEDLEGLAAPLAGALRGPLTDGVEALLATDLFQREWAAANRLAHETMVNILRDDTKDIVSTADGTVTLRLDTLVLQVAETLGIPESALENIPEDAGQIVIFESDELDTVQQAVKLLDFLAWFLFALVIVLYAFAVYLAKGARLAVLRAVGWSLFAVGVVVLIARTLAVRALVDAIVEDPGGRPTAEAVADIGTALLKQMGWSALIYGLLIVLFTSLMGTRGWATSVRRAIAPAFNASQGAVIGGTVVALLLLVWWSPGRAFEGWLTGLTLIALVIGAVAALRARTKQEFPDLTWDDVMGSLPFGRKESEPQVEVVEVVDVVEPLDA